MDVPASEGRGPTTSPATNPAVAALRARFTEVVTSEADLRTLGGVPSQIVIDKVVDVIDDMSRRFIAASPFILIGSVRPDGSVDVSPRGDPAGFVKVLDERTLAIPDRPGNRRFDTFLNLFDNPAVGIIFLVPAVGWTLRVIGQAVVVRDRGLREALTEHGKLPDHVMVVAVERAMSHCPKCLVRSGLWDPAAWPDVSDVPSLAEAVRVHARTNQSVEAVQAGLDRSCRDRLY